MYYKNQAIDYQNDGVKASVTILEIVSMLCPHGNNKEIFPDGVAFLCHFQGLPLEDDNGKIISYISGYAVVDDPERKLKQWVGGYLDQENVDLLSKNPETAVKAKIEDLENIWRETSLHTRCQSCKAKGEQCKKQLSSLINKAPFSFFSSPQFTLSKTKCGLEKAQQYNSINYRAKNSSFTK